ncbi:MAG: hypothetical protein U0836_01240 [Pirellulales bacterium]
MTWGLGLKQWAGSSAWGIGAWVVVSVVATAAGLHALWAHSYSPGDSAQPPLEWPGESVLTRSTAGPTLLFFVHPRCRCTKVSAAMLAAAAPATKTSRQTYVVAQTGPEFDAAARGALEEYAAKLGARLHMDLEDAERRRFGVHTSGQVVVYDVAGQLAFAGGVTAARGHEGPNPGQAALIALLRDERPAPANWPVFGCPLTAEARAGGRRP